jgi:hypothetical protein
MESNHRRVFASSSSATSSSSSTTTSTDASGEGDEPESTKKRPPRAPLAAAGAARLALNDRAEQRLMARLLQRGGTPRVAAYASQRAAAFGSGPVQLTEIESNLVLQRQEQFWAHPGSTRSDTGGDVVAFFVDGTRPFPSVSEASRVRCLFLLAAASCIHSARLEAVVVMVLLPRRDADDAQIDQVGRNLEAFLTIFFLMPVELDAMHFLPDGDDDASHLETFWQNLGPTVRPKSHVHAASSASEAAAALERHGLHRRALPSRLGGTMQRWQSSEWLLEQCSVVETSIAATFSARAQDQPQGADAALSPTDRHAVPFFTLAAAASASSPAPARRTAHSTSASHATLTPTSQEFIRKRNAVYARRKYARRKIEVEVLREQRRELEEQKQRLQAEGRRLEGLVRTAELYVLRLNDSQSRGHAEAAHDVADVASASPTLGTYRRDTGPSPLELAPTETTARRTPGAHDIGDSSPARNLLVEPVPPRDLSSGLSETAAEVTDSGSALGRYLESLREGGGGRGRDRDDPPSLSEQVASRRRNLEHQLALLHREQQQWQLQLQQQMRILRSAAASAAYGADSAAGHRQHCRYQQHLAQQQQFQQMQQVQQHQINLWLGPSSLRRDDPERQREEK